MNQLYFEAKVLNLYSEDYKYLQDQVTYEVQKSFKATLEPLSTAAIIAGFIPSINVIDPTKIDIKHTSSTGLFITQSGIIVESNANSYSIALSDSTVGTTNIICAEYYTVLGSYNKNTDTVVEGVASNIDYTNYAAVHDRIIDKFRIVIYTQSEYTALVVSGDRVLLGSVVANGTSPLTSISLTNRVIVSQRLSEGVVTLSKLDPAILIPEDNIQGTPTGEINDSFPSGTTSITLTDDLNKLRSEFKAIKGTYTWNEPTPGTLLNFDKALNGLHMDGDVPYGSNFNSTITTSSGIVYLTINSGKILVKGNIYSISIGDQNIIPLNYVPIYPIGDWNSGAGFELIQWSPDTLNTLVVDRFTAGYIIGDYDFHIRLTDGPLTECISVPTQAEIDADILSGDPDSIKYWWDAPNGVIYFSPAGRISAHFASGIRVFYKYGYSRYDSIDVTEAGVFNVVEGTATQYPAPAVVSGTNVRLLNILNDPFHTYTSDVTNCLATIEQVRDAIEILPTSLSLEPFTSNKITYYSAVNTPDTMNTTWILSTHNSKPIVVVSTANAFFITEFEAKEGDDLYIRATKYINAGTFVVNYNTVVGSSSLDGTTNINLHSAQETPAYDCLLPIATSLTEGYHRVKVEMTSADTSSFFGVVYGKIDTGYLHESLITNSIEVSNVHITGTNEASDLFGGSLHVAGGVSIEKNTYIGGHLQSTGNAFIANTLITPGAIELNLGLDTDSSAYLDFHSTYPTLDFDARIFRDSGVNGGLYINQHGAGAIIIQSDDTASTYVTSTLTSATYAQGALVINGGVGIGDNLSVKNNIACAGSINSTIGGSYTDIGANRIVGSPFMHIDTAGSNPIILGFYSSGGTSFGDGAGHITTSIDASGNATFSGSVNAQGTVLHSNYIKIGQGITVDTPTYLQFKSSATGDVDASITRAQGVDGALTITNISNALTSSIIAPIYVQVANTTYVNFTSSLDASNSTSGSIIINGGVGIAKKLFVGGTLDVQGLVISTNTVTSSPTNNLHLDSGSPIGTVYLNFYGGTGGTVFGNGDSNTSGASVSSSGAANFSSVNAGLFTGTSFTGTSFTGTSFTGTSFTGNLTGDVTGSTTMVKNSNSNDGAVSLKMYSGTASLHATSTSVNFNPVFVTKIMSLMIVNFAGNIVTPTAMNTNGFTATSGTGGDVPVTWVAWGY